MCDACQRVKGVKTGSAQYPRFFLHPYFDIFIAEQVLSLEIEPPYETPTFRMFACLHFTVEQNNLVQSHVRELNIEQRYAHFFRSQHRRLLRLVGGMRASGQSVVNGLAAFRLSFDISSKNSWDHVFYSSVLSNFDLIEYLEVGELPGYL